MQLVAPAQYHSAVYLRTGENHHAVIRLIPISRAFVLTAASLRPIRLPMLFTFIVPAHCRRIRISARTQPRHLTSHPLWNKFICRIISRYLFSSQRGADTLPLLDMAFRPTQFAVCATRSDGQKIRSSPCVSVSDGNDCTMSATVSVLISSCVAASCTGNATPAG